MLFFCYNDRDRLDRKEVTKHVIDVYKRQILNLLYLLVMTYFFASFIPSIALQVRRLRDAGFHWALIFLRFASFIGDIVLLVLCCQPTKVEFPFNNFNNLQQ